MYIYPPEPSGHASLHKRSYGNYMRLRRTIGSTERFREDPFGQVINFSTKSFSKPEYKLLGYNLNYIPTPNTINKKELAQDLKLFGRRIKLRDHFGISPTDKPAFKYHSTWEPNENHHTVKTFLEDFSRKVNSELESRIQIKIVTNLHILHI